MMHFEYMKNIRVVIIVVLKYAVTKEAPWEDMGVVMAKDMDEGEDMGAIAVEDMDEGEACLPLVSIVEKLVMYHGFVPNRTCLVHTDTILNISQRNVLT
jgi:hypothetical protein